MAATVEHIGNATLYCGTMEETIGGIDRVDHILTDPPYLYIKTHDFDRPWDEPLFFDNVKRLLPPKGFIAMFGRGTSFYRWNTRLADLGFVFKEEIVWNKLRSTTPCGSITRIHETVSIHTKKGGIVKNATIPYTESKKYDIGSIVGDVKRIIGAINTPSGFDLVKRFFESGGAYEFNDDVKMGTGLCVQTELPEEDRRFKVLRAIDKGMSEKSVLNLSDVRYALSHPTEKPVRLAERLLALISDPGDTIYDPFMGSGSFGVACINTGRKFIGSEMKPEYFEIAKRRIEEASAQCKLFNAA